MPDDIFEAAKLLGKQLVGHVPGVTGVSVRMSEFNPMAYELWVDLELQDATNSVPTTFMGFPVYTLFTASPRFAGQVLSVK